MYAVLRIPRSTYYYQSKVREINDDKITELVVQIFKDSRNVYGQRKIKKELNQLGYQISRRRIGRIMKEQGLVSKYAVAQYKVSKLAVNESKIDNVLNRKFVSNEPLKVIGSDLTYVRVKQNWHYICVLVDFYNSEIIGHSSGSNKDRSEEHTSELQSRGHL